jgi:hypothetical protein
VRGVDVEEDEDDEEELGLEEEDEDEDEDEEELELELEDEDTVDGDLASLVFIGVGTDTGGSTSITGAGAILCFFLSIPCDSCPFALRFLITDISSIRRGSVATTFELPAFNPTLRTTQLATSYSTPSMSARQNTLNYIPVLYDLYLTSS